jgi:hypothetical protein
MLLFLEGHGAATPESEGVRVGASIVSSLRLALKGDISGISASQRFHVSPAIIFEQSKSKFEPNIPSPSVSLQVTSVIV